MKSIMFLKIKSQFHYGSIQIQYSRNHHSESMLESQFHYGSIQMLAKDWDKYKDDYLVSIPLWFNSNPFYCYKINMFFYYLQVFNFTYSNFVRKFRKNIGVRSCNSRSNF